MCSTYADVLEEEPGRCWPPVDHQHWWATHWHRLISTVWHHTGAVQQTLYYWLIENIRGGQPLYTLYDNNVIILHVVVVVLSVVQSDGRSFVVLEQLSSQSRIVCHVSDNASIKSFTVNITIQRSVSYYWLRPIGSILVVWSCQVVNLPWGVESGNRYVLLVRHTEYHEYDE